MNKERKNKLFLIFVILIISLLSIFILYHGYIRETSDLFEKQNTTTTPNTNNTQEHENNQTNSDTSSIEQKYSWGPYDLEKDNENEATGQLKIDNNTNNQGVNNNGNNSDNNSDNNNEPTEEPDINADLTKEDVEKLKFMQEDKEFKVLNNLDIFKKFGNLEETKLIYPGLSGIYNFQVENYSDRDIMYKLYIIEENPHNVNMKFKLKRNGIYIAGNDSQYVDLSQLQKEKLVIASKKGENYILYWKWEDSDNDILSTSPMQRGEYKLTIKGEV